jgi:hypothetical protein
MREEEGDRPRSHQSASPQLFPVLTCRLRSLRFPLFTFQNAREKAEAQRMEVMEADCGAPLKTYRKDDWLEHLP